MHHVDGSTATAVLVLVMAAALASCKTTGLYVSPEGKADGSGSERSPLALEEAIRRASLTLQKSGVPEGGMTITVAEGHYYFRAPFILGPEFKGSKDRPIVIRAADGAGVVFDGSMRIDPLAFGPVEAPEERSRLAAGTADRILAATISEPVLIAKFNENLMLTLSFNGRECLPSVFPNEGYARFGLETVTPEAAPPAVPVGKQGYGIRAGNPPHQEPGKPQGWKGSLEEPRGARARFAEKEDEMAGTWEQWEREIRRNNTRNRLTGFIEANWLLSSQPICSASARDRCVHLSRVLSYGWAWKKNDKPFRVFGLLCELDSPGEWHFDTLTNRLFIYPPEPLTAETVIGTSVAPGFVALRDTAYVSIIGLSVQNVGSGSVYRIDGGHHNLVASCSVRHCTARGIEITGTHNGAIGCDLVDLNAHVALGGGVRSPTEITAGNNYVENCHVYQRDFRHEKVNISMSGVGNRFSSNLVHNSIGQAMTVNGNDHLIQLNEFFNVGFEEGDGGAVYSGADLAGYGNLYRHNFFHHLMHVPGKVTRSGIHLDDHQAGSICVGNVFYKCAAKGIFYNGGAGHRARDNVFLEGSLGIYNVGVGARKSHERQEGIFRDPNHMYRNTKENYVGRAEKVVGEKGWTKSPWRDRYPLFCEVMSDEGEHGRLWPIRCHIENNFYHGNTRANRTVWSRVDREAMEKNVIEGDRRISPDVFVDYESLDLRFREGRDGLPDIPFGQIGLRLDEWRSEMPDKAHYRKAVRAFFHGIGSMPGTKKQIDTARLVEEGPMNRRRQGSTGGGGE